MKEQLISFETAKLAKEKKFVCAYSSRYNSNGVVVDKLRLSDSDYELGYYAVTKSLLQKWLREKHNIHITVYVGSDEDSVWYDADVRKIENKYDDDPLFSTEEGLESYEKTLEIALQEALKLIN